MSNATFYFLLGLVQLGILFFLLMSEIWAVHKRHDETLDVLRRILEELKRRG